MCSKGLFPLIALSLVLLAASCMPTKYPVLEPAPASYAPLATRYDQLYYWAAHPWKQDPSDSTPKPFRNFVKDSTVDVFFIHPTTYTDDTAVAGRAYTTQIWNASLHNETLNAKTDFTSMLNQASAFNKYRVYAPRYRQAHIQSFSLPDSISKPFFDTAYADIREAFLYFLNTCNNNRPFIIASHSQGTLHAGRLIREMVEGTNLQNRMVAAYVVGLAVPDNYFSICRPCLQPEQTGCFVAWRTYREGFVPEWIAREKFKAVVINPVSWTADTLPVSRKQHKGAVLYQFNKPKSKNVSTSIRGNVLWSTKPRFFGNVFFTTKNYHIGDINLFWKDIRDNVDLRVSAFWKR